MRSVSRHKPTPATVLACTALVVAVMSTGLGDAIGAAGAKAGKSAAIALKLKRADKKASRALRIARKASHRARKAEKKANEPGTPGPPGRQGARGSTGDTGSRGPKGDTGPAGRNALVSRLRSTAPVQTSSDPIPGGVAIPMSRSGWTQEAEETDTIVGEITFTHPAACASTIGWLDLYVNSTWLDSIRFTAPSGGTIVRKTFDSRFPIFEPGVPTPRSMTAKVRDTGCPSDPNAHPVVESVKINLLRYR